MSHFLVHFPEKRAWLRLSLISWQNRKGGKSLHLAAFRRFTSGEFPKGELCLGSLPSRRNSWDISRGLEFSLIFRMIVSKSSLGISHLSLVIEALFSNIVMGVLNYCSFFSVVSFLSAASLITDALFSNFIKGDVWEWVLTIAVFFSWQERRLCPQDFSFMQTAKLERSLVLL